MVLHRKMLPLYIAATDWILHPLEGDFAICWVSSSEIAQRCRSKARPEHPTALFDCFLSTDGITGNGPLSSDSIEEGWSR